jgi:hypothetical protein
MRLLRATRTARRAFGLRAEPTNSSPKIEQGAEDVTKSHTGLSFQADYADIYEVRGMRRRGRGSDMPPPSCHTAG